LALQGAPFVGVGDARGEHLAALGAAVLGLSGLLRAGPGLGDAGGEDEVLAQGVAFEGLREEEVVQGGVTLEGDAEHFVGLAFVPGRAGVDVDGGGEGRCLVRDRRTQQQAAHGGQCHHVRRDAGARARFVDRAQPVEVGAGQAVAGHAQGVGPG
jgi:hypothetical protein